MEYRRLGRSAWLVPLSVFHGNEFCSRHARVTLADRLPERGLVIGEDQRLLLASGDRDVEQLC